jgi:hypothetical protein
VILFGFTAKLPMMKTVLTFLIAQHGEQLIEHVLIYVTTNHVDDTYDAHLHS